MMNSKLRLFDCHPEQREGSLLCGRTHESPSPPALSHRREREPVEEYATNQWRTLEAATHKPGALGSLVHKRVYTHTNGDATPEATADYTYGYDAVGNVYCVWDDDGNEVFYFAQDAFGNELPVDLLGQESWSDARAYGISEHQTGKWIDPFTGLYYFSARWYDSGVGRFVGRDPERRYGGEGVYGFAFNNPVYWGDPSGADPEPCCGYSQQSCGPWIIYLAGIAYIVYRCVEYFSCSVDCEKLVEELKQCVEAKLRRPVTNEEIALIPPYILENFPECQKANETLLNKHVKPSSPQADHILNPQNFQCPSELTKYANQITIIIRGWRK